MADPNSSKLPSVETFDPRNMPSQVGSPSRAYSTPNPMPDPPMYETVHRPPPPTSPSTIPQSEPDHDHDHDHDTRTININIQINIPGSIRLPCFRRRCRHRHREDGRGLGFHGSEIPIEEKRRRFLAFLILLFYISFIVCGAVAWHIKNHHGVYTVSVVPCVIATFSPLLDLFVLWATTYVIRRYRNDDKPSARYAFLFLLNILLLALHISILIVAIVYENTSYRNSWSYYGHQWQPVIGDLLIYNNSTLISFKLITFLIILKSAGLRNTFGQSVRRIPSAIGEEFRYQVLTQDVDDDAEAIRGATATADRGRVYLD